MIMTEAKHRTAEMEIYDFKQERREAILGKSSKKKKGLTWTQSIESNDPLRPEALNPGAAPQGPRIMRPSTNTSANTIEGLHPKRKVSIKAGTMLDLKDFGSGWRGLIARKLPKGMRGVTGPLGWLEKHAGNLMGAFTQSSFKHNIIIDTEQIASKARQMGVTYKEYLQGTIAHERYHQGLAQHNLRGEMTALNPKGIVPPEFTKWYLASNPGAVAHEASGGASLTEEYFAYAHTASKFHESTEFTKMFEPAWDRLGIKAKSRKIVMSEATRETQQGTQVLGLHGGHGHNTPKNKSGGFF